MVQSVVHHHPTAGIAFPASGTTVPPGFSANGTGSPNATINSCTMTLQGGNPVSGQVIRQPDSTGFWVVAFQRSLPAGTPYTLAYSDSGGTNLSSTSLTVDH
jgi:hypothetical protein